MRNVFGRRYSLVIGRLPPEASETVAWSKQEVTVVSNSRLNPTVGGTKSLLTSDYRKEQGAFIRITDLDLKAEVAYMKSTSDKGGTQNNIIEISNLSDQTKAKIREKDLIFLKAGYQQDVFEEADEDSLPLIFAGQIITKTTTRKNDGTTVTELICGDNRAPKITIKVSESWGPETLLSTVINDLLEVAAANGVPTGKVFGLNDIDSPIAQQLYTYGYSANGNLFNEIQKVCDSIDFLFYTALGKIYIEPRTGRSKGDRYTFIRLNPERLKKPIEYISDGSTPKGEDTREGVIIHIFLDGRISPEMLIQIYDLSEEFDGTYTIKAIKHSLEYEGSDWDTVIECMRVV